MKRDFLLTRDGAARLTLLAVLSAFLTACASGGPGAGSKPVSGTFSMGMSTGSPSRLDRIGQNGL